MSSSGFSNAPIQISPNLNQFKKLIVIPLTFIITFFIIIMITTDANINDKNSLNALLTGYIGLFIGLLFLMSINLLFMKTSFKDMIPIFMLMVIVTLMSYYVYVYFDKILLGHISSYYSIFSKLSLVFLAIQLVMIFNVMYKANVNMTTNTKLFTDTNLSLLGLFSVINILIVLIIGIVLNFYSTQG